MASLNQKAYSSACQLTLIEDLAICRFIIPALLSFVCLSWEPKVREEEG